MNGWIGVDLDGTLAHYDGWKGPGHIGAPVPRMLERVKRHLADGDEVRIFTARASARTVAEYTIFQEAMDAWCVEHLGVALPIVCCKDFQMLRLYDDRAIQIIPNTGERADGLD